VDGLLFELLAGTLLIFIGAIFKVLCQELLTISKKIKKARNIEKQKYEITSNSENDNFINESTPVWQLNKLLDQRKITCRKLSQITGIRHVEIAKLCRNETEQINIHVLKKICYALNTSVADILKIPSRSNDIIIDEM
jgi:DNA-binding Xre family transcriptional regulator